MAKRNCIDKSTGEIVQEPNFVKLYIEDLCTVKGLSSTQYKMFNFMLENMNWDNIVASGPNTKDKFLTENNLINQTFNNNISRLIQSGLIERMGRGEFLINKKYAVKVEWSKVQKIRWVTEYTKKGKKQTVEFK
jgi:hypothetical protein